MSLKVRLNGQDYTDFIGAAVARSMETAATAFTFTSTANPDNLFPIKNGDKVEILADGETVCIGFVEDISVSYDAASHTITIKGRSLLADLVDSTVGEIKEFEGQVNFEDIIRTVLDSLTLIDIKIINKAGKIENFSASDITSAETGQNAFDFLELYARKRQVLITTNGSGNLVIARAGQITSLARLKHMVGANDNNVLSATLRDNKADLFNRYTANSQLNPVNLKPGSNAKHITDQASSRFDTFIRKSRVFEFNAEESSDAFTLHDRAGWEANIRRARAKTYTAKVQGHSAGGVVWEPNRLHRVDDDFTETHAKLLLKSVTYNYDLSGGSSTMLGFTNKFAYTLKVQQTARDASTNEFGEDF